MPMKRELMVWFNVSSSCYVSQLEKHLERCNSRPKPLPEYIQPNINIQDDETEDIKISLADLSDEELLSTIDRTTAIHSSN